MGASLMYEWIGRKTDRELDTEDGVKADRELLERLLSLLSKNDEIVPLGLMPDAIRDEMQVVINEVAGV